MIKILDLVQEYFIEKDWPVDRHEDLPILRFEYEGENGSWFCYARVREEANQFIFLSTLTEKVPEEKRLAIAEYLTRANFGLNIGNFEMDFDDGEVRYKTSIDVTQDRLTLGLIDPLIQASFVVMDDYLPGFKSILKGEITPKEAIQQVQDEQDEYDLLL
ncbi:YbjN domain-containing protein [Tumidithrix helvetica PCC 7403]|uniref:YbjN domain-containing protein n=1 Tax=Tumidithrix helvetica TaxID=3457545 RepID=UPI003CAEB703